MVEKRSRGRNKVSSYSGEEFERRCRWERMKIEKRIGIEEEMG